MARKTRKRANGEGTLVKKPNGSWEARISVKDPITNKSEVKTFCRKSKSEVQEWLDEIRNQLHSGQYVGNHKVTLGEWLTTWLNIYKKNRVRQTTWESYDSVVRVHIIPAIGELPLQKLKAEHIERLCNEKLEIGRKDGKGGLSVTTVNYIISVLKDALKKAVKDGLIVKNIADNVDSYKKEKKEIHILNIEQLKKFLTVSRHSKYYPAYLLECYTGLRRGELLALRWCDIKFADCLITVNQGLTRTKRGLHTSELKTKASRRSIPINEQVISELRDIEKRQAQERLLAGSAYEDSDLIFCNCIGRPLDPRSFTKSFEKLLVSAGLPRIRFHDLRHTHATLLISKGQNVKVVQERLGHTTARMTIDTYTHVIEGMQKQATDIIAQALC